MNELVPVLIFIVCMTIVLSLVGVHRRTVRKQLVNRLIDEGWKGDDLTNALKSIDELFTEDKETSDHEQKP